MKTRMISQSGKYSFKNYESEAWQLFEQRLISCGLELSNENFFSKVDALICHGYSKKAIKEAQRSNVPKNHRVLVLWEPPIINPKLHRDQYLKNFGHIYTPSKLWAKKFKTEYFNYPVGKFEKEDITSNLHNRSHKIVMIQANKYSLIKGENYSLRRALVTTSNLAKEHIETYGTGWQKFPFKDFVKSVLKLLRNLDMGISKNSIFKLSAGAVNARGTSNNKIETLKKYKISIVIENHSSYVSEKLFDSLNAGCVTVYVGPNLENFGLNNKMVIQVEPDHDKIEFVLEKLLSMSDSELGELRDNQNKFLALSAPMWENTKVLSKLADDICKNLFL
jgi:hypothetical protein